MSRWDTAWRALRDAAGLHGLRFHDLRHTVITELAEMGVADHVLESISGHLSRRMLEHYSHIRIDAKRQALDALDNLRRGGDGANGNGKPANAAEIETVVEVADDLTSQSRRSLLLQGSPPSGKLLIPLERRDVRVVVLLRGYAASAGHLAVARAELTRERRRMKEHAWKAIPRTRADAHQIPPTPFRSTSFRNDDVRLHVLVNHRVAPWFRGACDTVLTQNLV